MKAIHIERLIVALVVILSTLMTPGQTGQAVGLRNATAATLPFSQDWSDTGLITTNDDWSGVPAIIGYLGNYSSNDPADLNIDPQTLVDIGAVDVDVIANQTNTGISNGGVAEFHLSDPVVALQGSATADAPYLLISIDTTGLSGIRVAYNLRDIDGSNADNSAQQVALHYRLGATGSFTNLPDGYVADATTGPNEATLVTPVSVILPSAANNQSLVQLRIMTTNASGSDEWVGIDDISITSGAADAAPTVSSTLPSDGATGVAVDAAIMVEFSEAVTANPGWFALSCGGSTVDVGQTVDPNLKAYTLTPTSSLSNGKNCAATIDHTKIIDQDGTLDNMAQDYTWSFSTAPVDSDLMPAVNSTTPVDGAVRLAIDTSLEVTFSESVSLSTVNLSCNDGDVPVSVNSSDQTTFTVDPTSDLPYGAACTLTVPAINVTDSAGQNMTSNVTVNFTVTQCGDDTWTPISSIQGSGSNGALGVKTTQGFVTAKMSDAKGFYIQSAVGEADSESLTSEGLYVYSTNSGVSVGDYVRVTGSISEYQNLTEMGTATYQEICPSGDRVAPTAIDIDLTGDVTSVDYLERYENMLVNFTGTLTVQQNYFQGRYGQVTLGAGGRIFGQTNGGSIDNYLHMVILDDWSSNQNPNPISYYPYEGALRAGDTVNGVAGVLNQGAINSTTSPAVWPYNYYRVQPLVDPVFTTVNPREDTPPVVGGAIKVASFNVENYFTTLDTGSYTYPYSSSNTPRGADTAAEFTRQKDKIVAGIQAIDADVVGLMEIESYNNAGALADLVAALNASIGGSNPTYAAIVDTVPDPDGSDTGYDFIQVAIIYKLATVTPFGKSQIDDRPLVYDRVPVAQTFQVVGSGEKFTVVVNHFKSKGSCPSSGEDADQGDGQGCWNARRVLQAEALLDFVDTLSATDPDVLVMGDLNSYSEEDPIDTLKAGGLVDQVAAFVPFEQRYSYIFDGTSGYLDHMLSTASVVGQVTGASFWHINADEPSVIDYNTEYKNPDLYTDNVFRSSDHDPVIIGLALANNAPVLETPIADQIAFQGKTFTLTVPADAFLDADPGDTLTYSATLANGDPLPAWLSFNPVTRSFSGTPVLQDIGSLTIKVMVKDTSDASASLTFGLLVKGQIYMPLVFTLP